MPLHKSRPDCPVETPEKPRVPCWHLRGNLRFQPQLQMRTSAPAATSEESRVAPGNTHGDWTFLKPHERVTDVHITTREEPQVRCRNSRKTRRFSSQCEMKPFSTVASLEFPPSLLSLERVLDTLDATQEVPRHTSLHSRGTPRIPSLLKRSPSFPSSSLEEGPFTCFIGKGILAFLSHLKRRRSQLYT